MYHRLWYAAEQQWSCAYPSHQKRMAVQQAVDKTMPAAQLEACFGENVGGTSFRWVIIAYASESWVKSESTQPAVATSYLFFGFCVQ